MRREKEFEAYLASRYPKRNTVDNYISYCRTIGKVYDMDMDDIVAMVGDNADAVEAYLKKNMMKTDVSNYKSGYRRYVEFCKTFTTVPFSSASTPIVYGVDPETALVKYESSVLPGEQPMGLCQFLEDVYPDVLRYAEHVLGDVLGLNFDPIPVFLSKEKPKETYLPNFSRDKKKLVKHICQGCEACSKSFDGQISWEECEMRDMCCPIREILEAYWRKIKTTSIVGRFFADPQPHIVLYFRNLNPSTLFESAAHTLAHEYLHHLHYCYAEKAAFDKKEVSEALADFFCAEFSLNRGTAESESIAQRTYQSWKDNKCPTWPYAWALHFLPKPYRKNVGDYEENEWIQKYLWVFRHSTNPVCAFDMLKK